MKIWAVMCDCPDLLDVPSDPAPNRGCARYLSLFLSFSIPHGDTFAFARVQIVSESAKFVVISIGGTPKTIVHSPCYSSFVLLSSITR